MLIGRLLCVLLIVTVCLGRRDNKPKPFQCPKQNEFIKRLSKRGVKTFKKAFVTTSSCAFEFGTYGTCCKEEDLLRFATGKTKGLMEDVSFINEEYKRFRGVLSQAYQLLEKVASAPKNPSRPKWDRFIKGAQEKLKNPKFQEYFANHMDSAKNTEHFTVKNTKCWEMQAKAREVALCYTCSGRSHHFFQKEKALISQETCDAFVRDCRYSLSALVKFIMSFQEAKLIFGELKKLGINLNFETKLDMKKLSEYFTAFKSENIEHILETSRNLHRPEIKAQMCSKFLRLGDKPIISQMRAIFNSADPWILHKHEMADYMAQARWQGKSQAPVPQVHPPVGNSVGNKPTSSQPVVTKSPDAKKERNPKKTK